METKKSYCRICTAYCGIEVDVEGDRVTAVRGDASDPVTGGYTCVKGRELPYQIGGPGRLRGSQKRLEDGSFEPISSATALDEIAAKLEGIIERHGPRAVASFSGTAAFANSATLPVTKAWHRGFGSFSNYSTLTIDQPSKIIAAARHGIWAAGPHPFRDADVILSVGNNPIISGLTLPGGPPGTNPSKTLADAQRRGLKVICVDPRRSELARRADIHLQLRPGEDPTLLAGMLRTILSEGLHDRDFCRDHAEGLEELEVALEGFDPKYVEARAGVSAAQMQEAARLFARGPRGYASSGTGPDMAPRPSLSEHLISCLNTVCGRYLREGEKLPNPGVLAPPLPRPAQVVPYELLPPEMHYGEGPKSRARGLHQIYEEMPATTLAEEILEPGEGQIRAVIVSGGNPAVAVPNPREMIRALEALELCVCIDITLTQTTRRADYVIAARHSLERDDVTEFMDRFYEQPYCHYSEAVVAPELDVLEEWEVFAGLAQRMGTPIELPGGALDLQQLPSKFELLKLIRPVTRVALERIRDQEGGHVFEEVEAVAGPPLPGMEARFQMVPDTIADELRTVRGEELPSQQATRFSHLLICRRVRHVSNSVGHDFPSSSKYGPANLAYMNRDDVAALGLSAGELIKLESEAGEILGVVEPTDDLRTGVISMAHGFGGDPAADPDVRKHGSNTSLLITAQGPYDPLTGMARQSAIPVSVTPMS